MTDEDPVERKVQVTGGSTYTVSLPKDWAGEQGIEAGSKVLLYSREDSLLVSQGDHQERRRKITIQSENREPEDLARTVAAAYIAGGEEVRVEGMLDNQQRQGVRDAVAGLVGIEVHEEGDSFIVARTMLDVADLSPEQTLVQMQMTALSMHEDSVDAVVEGDVEKALRVQQQDDDVDRLFGLICREFQRSLVDVGVPMRADGLTKFEFYTSARQIERVADHAVKIAEVAELMEQEPPQEIAEKIDAISHDSRELVRRAVDGLLEDDDPDELGAIVVESEALTEKAGELDRLLYDTDDVDGYHLGTVVDSLVRTAEYGVNVAEAGLQVSMREPEIRRTEP